MKALIEKTKTQRQALQTLLVRLSPDLAQDPFGNYAIQSMLQAWPDTVDLLICRDGPLLPKMIVDLSLQKFSSNVVDRLIQSANLPQILMIMQELDQSEKLDKIMVSQYGNFVL